MVFHWLLWNRGKLITIISYNRPIWEWQTIKLFVVDRLRYTLQSGHSKGGNWAPPRGGAWWRIDRFGAFFPKGRGFESRFNRHVEILVKSFTRRCLWRFGVKLRHIMNEWMNWSSVEGRHLPPCGENHSIDERNGWSRSRKCFEVGVYADWPAAALHRLK